MKLTTIFASGLAVVFAEDLTDIPEVDEPTGVFRSSILLHLSHVYSTTEAWKNLCPIFNSLEPSQTYIQTVTATPPP